VAPGFSGEPLGFFFSLTLIGCTFSLPSLGASLDFSFSSAARGERRPFFSDFSFSGFLETETAFESGGRLELELTVGGVALLSLSFSFSFSLRPFAFDPYTNIHHASSEEKQSN